MTLSVEQIKAIIIEGTEHRGWISNSFAQIEFLLGDLIVRCRQFPEYTAHTETVSHSAPKRAAKVQAMLQIDGPLTQFADDLSVVIDAFTSNQSVRNLLAHGYCEFYHTPTDDAGFVFRKFDRDLAAQTGDDSAVVIRTFRLVDLEFHRVQMIAQSNRAMDVISGIHAHFGWMMPTAE